MRLRLALLLVLLVTSVAACGDGDSGETAAGSEVERSEYAEQVNAICAESSADVEAVTTQLLESGTSQDAGRPDFIADSLEAALPITRDATAEAAALPRPTADEATLEDFWTRIEDSYPIYERLIEAIRSEDRGEFSKLNADFAAIAADTRPVAEDLGLTSCIPDAPAP